MEKNESTKYRYFLEIAYDGTNYCGWQVQPNGETVQGMINQALSTIFNEPLHCLGCGRTDSGVHASKFVLHVDTTQAALPINFIHRINKILPTNIAVYDVFLCDKHARFDATYRAYDYYVHFEKSPFKNQFSFFFPFKPLDIAEMEKAFNMLSEYEDFSPFEKSKSSSKTSICQIYKTELYLSEDKKELRVHIAANRFLRGMIRRIVGTLLMVGLGRLSLEEFKNVMKTQGTFSMNLAVPGCGLFLSEVRYDNYCMLRVRCADP